MKRFLLFFAAALLFVACDNKFEDEGNTIQRVSSLPTLTAEFADEDTRTYVEDNTYLRWHEGDLISAFVGNTRNSKYIFDGKTGDNSGTFGSSESSLGSSDKLDRNYALYPYDKSAEISADGVISCSLPAVQEYVEESFGKGANTMVAVTKDVDDTFLAFKNACGYLKIKLYGKATVKSIELKGNNGEKIAGEASITATYGGVPTVAMAKDATESITLDCGEGVKLSTDAEKPTEFWFVVPPTEFSDGLTIVATDTNGITFEKSTSNAVAITRNEIQPMAAVEVIFPEAQCPNNEIWYTSTDGEVVEPCYTNVFGANIVSNTYKDGKGVITFDGDVSAIGDLAFFGCRSLSSVTIPDSVTTIGNAAFNYCYNLENATISDRLTSIGEEAFYQCDDLTSITIPNSVTSIGSGAFSNCQSLKEIHISDIAAWCKIDFEDYYSNPLSYAKNLYLNNTLITELNIPINVTTIGERTFRNFRALTSVTIPDSVTTIGDWAFAYCRSLTSVTIGDGVTSIGESAFTSCTTLTSVTIGNSVTTIGESAFSNCYSLTSVTIPDSVTTIGDSAFSECDSLTSITIPDSVISIGNAVFVSCDSLKEFKGKFASDGGRCLIVDGVLNSFANGCGDTEYTIPSSVTSIGFQAFIGCRSLSGVTIPNSVTSIGYQAFFGCSSVTSITIPDSVTTIGEWAFYACYSLRRVYCKATTPPTAVCTYSSWNAFDNNASGRKIYVLRGCGSAYRSAFGWGGYFNDIVEYDF